MDSFYDTLEIELLDNASLEYFVNRPREFFMYIEGWYSHYHRYSALGNLSPAEYVRRHQVGT